MLEKERFLAIKHLAHDIREDNKKVFKSFKKLPYDEALKKKNEFIDSVIDNMDIAFSDGEKGREEKQIFRANILLPDDKEFYETYSKDKNVRSLMNKYNVGIEDIMSKITELNVYENYMEDYDKEVSYEEPTFIDEMVKITPSEAESLLDEIDNLSSVMEDLDINVEEKPELLKPEKIEEKEESSMEDSLDDITDAVSNFVDRFENMQSEIDAKDEKIRKLQLEIEKLDQISSEASKEKESTIEEIKNLKEENTKYLSEIDKLTKENKDLSAKLAKSKEILNKDIWALEKISGYPHLVQW